MNTHKVFLAIILIIVFTILIFTVSNKRRKDIIESLGLFEQLQLQQRQQLQQQLQRQRQRLQRLKLQRQRLQRRLQLQRHEKLECINEKNKISSEKLEYENKYNRATKLFLK